MAAHFSHSLFFSCSGNALCTWKTQRVIPSTPSPRGTLALALAKSHLQKDLSLSSDLPPISVTPKQSLNINAGLLTLLEPAEQTPRRQLIRNKQTSKKGNNQRVYISYTGSCETRKKPTRCVLDSACPSHPAPPLHPPDYVPFLYQQPFRRQTPLSSSSDSMNLDCSAQRPL